MADCSDYLPPSAGSMRLCVVYDCLFPCTVGGAERWYRNVAERLAEEGHDVTYLTLRQWERGDPPQLRGVRVVAAGPRMDLYTTGGRRRILPPFIFGIGVLAHLLGRGSRYDAVHTASFPYFSLLAAAAARPLHRYQLVADWHEVWTREYWRDYLGRAAGLAGWLVQLACVRVPQRAFCFSRLHAHRLDLEGLRGKATVLEGEYAGSLDTPVVHDAEDLVVFAGRHIPEKRVPALVSAIAAAREVVPDLRCLILGDGPERFRVLAAIEELGLEDAVSAPGFVPGEEVEEALSSALCMVLPSRREGYGLVVVEASARAVPSVVVKDPDNAATELVDEGENGVVAASAEAGELAAAILRVRNQGRPLRESTAAWFERNSRRLSIDGSLNVVSGVYSERSRARR